MTGEERLTLSEVHHVAAGEYAEIAQIVGRLLADARLTDPGSLRIEVRWTEMWVEEDDDWFSGNEVTVSASLWARPIDSAGTILDQADVP